MTLLVKRGGAYAEVAGVFIKRSGVYSAVQEVYCKISGVYASVMFNLLSLFAAGEKGVWYDPPDMQTLFQDSAGTTPVTAVGQPVGLMLDKSGNGYHATQSTSTARPVLGREPIGGRRNLLTYTEDFGNAAWLKQGVAAVTANAGAAPDSTISADRLVWSGTSARSLYVSYQQAITASVFTWSIYVKANSATPGIFRLRLYGPTIVYSPNIVPTSEWVRYSLTASLAAGTLAYVSLETDTANTPNLDILIWGAQLELGSTPTAYQKVVSALDVTEAGKNDAYYFDTDGVDDNATLAAGGGGTTGFFLCAAVHIDTLGTAKTIWSDAGTNTGYILRINASNQLELAAGNGTAYTLAATAATLAINTAYVVTAWDDGTNLNVQVNSGTAGTAARPVVSAGTATATIGKDNGAATGFFNGGVYPLIYVKNGENVDAADRTAAKAYVASKAGVTI